MANLQRATADAEALAATTASRPSSLVSNGPRGDAGAGENERTREKVIASVFLLFFLPSFSHRFSPHSHSLSFRSFPFLSFLAFRRLLLKRRMSRRGTRPSALERCFLPSRLASGKRLRPIWRIRPCARPANPVAILASAL